MKNRHFTKPLGNPNELGFECIFGAKLQKKLLGGGVIHITLNDNIPFENMRIMDSSLVLTYIDKYGKVYTLEPKTRSENIFLNAPMDVVLSLGLDHKLFQNQIMRAYLKLVQAIENNRW